MWATQVNNNACGLQSWGLDNVGPSVNQVGSGHRSDLVRLGHRVRPSARAGGSLESAFRERLQKRPRGF